VQNLGAAAVSPQITFTDRSSAAPGPGEHVHTSRQPIQPNIVEGVSTRASRSVRRERRTLLCSVGGADCLADGEYSVRISASGGTLAAAMNVISDATAMGYAR